MTASNLRGKPATEVLAAIPAVARPSRQLRAAFMLWLVAVAAGLFETTLVVVDATAGDLGSAAEVAVGVGIRLLVFTGLV
jgi:hypothetical protein